MAAQIIGSHFELHLALFVSLFVCLFVCLLATRAAEFWVLSSRTWDLATGEMPLQPQFQLQVQLPLQLQLRQTIAETLITNWRSCRQVIATGTANPGPFPPEVPST